LFLIINVWKEFGFFVIQDFNDVIEWKIGQTTIKQTSIGWTIEPKPLKQVIAHII
jgi:hypothetical protein